MLAILIPVLYHWHGKLYHGAHLAHIHTDLDPKWQLYLYGWGTPL